MSGKEEASQSGSNSAIPKSVLNNLVEFNKALGEVESAFTKHFEIDFSKHINERSVLDLTRIDVMSVFALTSLGRIMSHIRGEDPDNNADLRNEMNRSNEYSDRLKILQERRNAPRLNTTAAKNFIRNALWEIPETEIDAATASNSNKKRKTSNETTSQTKKKKA